MEISEQLRDQLQDALAHLYDPDYQPLDLLYAIMGCDPRNGPVPVQSAIIQAVRDLEPDSSIPRGARVRRVYDVMYHRYVLKLTQEQTAELLNLSVRHLNRVQREAVYALARLLWERHQASEQLAEGRSREKLPQEEAPGDPTLDWYSQTRHELASLRASAPGAVSDVEETINGVLELESVLVSRRGVRLAAEFVQPGLVAAIHPSALRQILITAVGRLARYTSTGQITIFAGLEDGNVKITINGPIVAGERPTESDLIRDILTPEDISVEVSVDGDHVFLRVKVPSVGGKITVLAVDDNVDMAHFYRRATAGTRYHIVHVAEGQSLLATIEAIMPDIIVLDIMLPDVDGWKLLMHLHENPATRSTPVIICTVVREEELALSLGAALYLPKPVRPREFIQALDRALSQAPTAATISPANSAATC